VGSFGNAKVKEGMKVKMTNCGIAPNGSPYYHFEPAE
jgi:hypothetical protein